MGSRGHRYAVTVEWTGNTGAGTATYGGYSRDHLLTTPGKPAIEGSSDPDFRGDPERWNPEEMLVAAVAACHQLWYLHLCASAGIRVVAYRDAATGVMAENADGSGQFTQVTLRPEVTIGAENNVEHARALHEEASRLCFIARSIRFPIKHEPVIIAE